MHQAAKLLLRTAQAQLHRVNSREQKTSRKACLQDHLVALVLPLLEILPRVRDPKTNPHHRAHDQRARHDGLGAEAGVPHRVREVQHCSASILAFKRVNLQA